MINKVLKSLVFALLTLYFVACIGNSDESSNKILGGNQNVLQNEYEKSWEKIYFKEINQRIKGTEITTLRNVELPNDFKEIRIWVGFSTSPLKGLILKQNDKESLALFAPPLDSNNEVKGFQKLPSPKKGWENLWKKLDALDLMNLLDPMDIADIDGKSVVIEIKSGNSYKNYKYSSIEKSKDSNYRKVMEICNFLTSEFNVDL